jgi:hypothetical protein
MYSWIEKLTIVKTNKQTDNLLAKQAVSPGIPVETHPFMAVRHHQRRILCPSLMMIDTENKKGFWIVQRDVSFWGGDQCLARLHNERGNSDNQHNADRMQQHQTDEKPL